jgi:hypothetical protein
MPANDEKFGISRHTGTLIDSVETDDSVQVKELPGSNGEIARVNAWRASAHLQSAERTLHGRRSVNPYRKMTEGSVKGHGALAVVPGVGDPGVSGLPNGGVTVITNVKQSESNEDFDGWERPARERPSA